MCIRDRHRVDVVENGVAVDVAGDEVRDHLHRDVRQLAVPGIEHAAPDGLVVGNVVMPSVVSLAAAEVGVGGEHALELEDGRVDHAAVVPVSYTHLDVYKRQSPR